MHPLQAQNLHLCDFPNHDMSADFVLLAEQRQVEADLKEQYEVGLVDQGQVEGASHRWWVYHLGGRLEDWGLYCLWS